jgi:ABC-type dipeptide/oligopeptide/nickel transport system permease subunit
MSQSAPASTRTRPAAAPPPRGPWALAAERFLRHRLAMVCGVVFLSIVLLCFIGPFVSAHDANDQNLNNAGQAPSWTHWMGTDSVGRDVLTRTLMGGRLSIAIGLVATLVAVIIGTTFGAIAGYVGGRLDAFMMRFAPRR